MIPSGGDSHGWRIIGCAAATACLCTLWGCAAHDVGTPVEVEPVSIRDEWRAQYKDDLVVVNAAAVNARWWEAFGDPQLEVLIERALANNTQIAVAVSRLRQVRGQEQATRGKLFPKLDASASGQWSHLDIPIDLLGYQVDVTSDGWSALPSLQASYEVDLFGRIRNQADAATLQRLAAAAARDSVALSIAAATASNYLRLLALDAQYQLLLDTLASREKSVELQRKRYSTGYSSRLALRQAEIEYADTRSRIPEVELSIRQTENALTTLLGQPPSTIPRGMPFIELAVPAVPATLPSELLRRRPDIATSEYQLIAADHSLESARALFLPSFNLKVQLQRYFSEGLDDPIKIFSVGGSVLAPIFEAGRIAGQVEQAAGVRDQAAFSFRDNLLNALREVEDGLEATSHYSEAYTVTEARYQAVLDAYALATERYLSGYTSYLTQLDIQRALYVAQQGLINARLNQLTAHVNLFRALGGGWDREQARCEEKPDSADCPGEK